MRFFLTISGVVLCWVFPALIDRIQFYIFLGIVGTIGMAHGSLDHLVHRAEAGSNFGMLRFYACYLFAIGIVGFVWWMEPLLGLGLFAASSAYHFGQAEIPDRGVGASIFLWVRRFSWGMALLSIPLIVHVEELQLALQEWKMNTAGQTLEFGGWAVLILSIGCYFLASWVERQNSSDSVSSLSMMPMASWMGYAILLWVSPPLWGFTLYFGIWHAWPALKQVSKALDLSKTKDWMKALLPNYLPSLMATITWIWLASYWMPEYVVAGLLILLSALTVPHTFVFERLYRKT